MNQIAREQPSATVEPGAARRLDVALVDAGLFESRAKAREAIEAGLVSIDGREGTKPAERVLAGARLSATPAYPWVSRGGVKLAAALDRFGIDPAGQACLDVGASTGGFTDVLLQRGATQVYAADVGRDQLHPRLRHDARVADWSGTDIRTLMPDRFPQPPTLAVCDVSFISLSLVLPAVVALLGPDAAMVALIKPQFEAGRGGTRRGLVRDAATRDTACRKVTGCIEDAGWHVLGLVESPITGGDGNVEYLVGARRR